MDFHFVHYIELFSGYVSKRSTSQITLHSKLHSCQPSPPSIRQWNIPWENTHPDRPIFLKNWRSPISKAHVEAFVRTWYERDAWRIATCFFGGEGNFAMKATGFPR